MFPSAKIGMLVKYCQLYCMFSHLMVALVFQSQAVYNTSSIYASVVCVCVGNALKCELKWKIFAVRK